MSTQGATPASTDPRLVNDRAELATCLRALLDRRGMSYSAVTKAAELLPRRNGQSQSLPRSTLSDMLAGKRLPPKEKLLTLLAACKVPADDVPQWLAAWDRARTDSNAPSTTAPTDPVPQRAAIHGWSRTAILMTATTLVTICATVFALWLALGGFQHSPQIARRLTVTDWNWSHWSPDALPETHAAYVNAGTNFFYCWTIGKPFARDNETSDKWVNTVDATGNKDVYISILYLQNHDTRDLPECH